MQPRERVIEMPRCFLGEPGSEQRLGLIQLDDRKRTWTYRGENTRGLLVMADGRRFAVELEASRKEAERIRSIATEYMSGLRGPNALAGVIWYARPELEITVEHLRRAVAELGLAWAFDIRSWEVRP